ncbi:Mismatch repair protein msh3 [Tulasnella sp. 425]|nr:Mismatch repair protein msh3 [Tulasnella sp. 425]
MAPSGSKASTQPTLSAFFTSGPGAKQQLQGQSKKRVRATTPIDLTTLDESDDGNGSEVGSTASTAKRPRLVAPNNDNDDDDDVQSVTLEQPTSSGTVSRFFAPKTPIKTKPKQAEQFTPRPIGASPVSKYIYRPSPTKGTANLPSSSKKQQPSSSSIVPATQYPDDDHADEEMPTESERRAIEARRDAFRRKFLGDGGGHFERTDSQGLQISEDPFAENEQERVDESRAPSSRASEAGDEEGEAEIVEVPSVSEKLKKFAASSAAASSSRSSTSVKGPAKKPPTTAKGKTRKVKEVGPEGQEYTPLELQVKACKEAHPECLLLFEVGYKYRFFGTDAQIASKELGIACWMDRNFMTASIPVHRKTVHVKKLIAQGHKVGIIGQTETAALKKVGDNKGGPFERQLTELYTATTYVDELDSADDESRASPPTLTCLVESLLGGMGADQRVLIGMVSVIPSTGEVTYDEWEDGHMRTELETRITHIRPAELLIPGPKRLSKSTAKMLEYFTGNKRFNAGRNIRVERFSEQMSYTDAFGFVKNFYTSGERSSQRGDVMATIVDFPKQVIIALAHAIQYLTNFKVADAFLEATFFSTFASRTHMLLNGTTLTNLEIYRNSTDFTEKGSLLWILDHTKTRFGSRMLKSWIGRPLVDKSILQERIDAVEEILDEPPSAYDKLASLLKGLPDLARGLARITYGKCTPKELATLLTAYQRIGNAFEPLEDPSHAGFKSALWNDIVSSLPRLRKPVSQLLEVINLSKARSDDKKSELWVDDEQFEELANCKFALLLIESDLKEELKSSASELINAELALTLDQRPTLNWTTVAGNEYLIEVRHAEANKVPANWLRVSSTKAYMRFHTPEVKRKLEEREQQRERLVKESEAAWQSFLSLCNQYYAVFRDVTSKLATADCLQSLAVVAVQPGYRKPNIIDDDKLEIVDGRHPMAEAVRSDPFVPNSVTIGGGETRTKIITGPNMNGKSTCCRMIALITIMAQVGSYVPATRASLSLHDCILTRMGAADDLARGHSTFMVELQETSDIMRQATSRSLIILDELGRGTSTHDGQAIASAVLEYLQTIKRPKILFITHYPLLAAEFAEEFEDVANLHMAHGLGAKRPDGTTAVNFLYRLAPGMASGSYGIECGRVAGLPPSVLAAAQKRSDSMKADIERTAGSHKWKALLETALNSELSATDRATIIRRLRTTML